jgi:hypothetical protein
MVLPLPGERVGVRENLVSRRLHDTRSSEFGTSACLLTPFTVVGPVRPVIDRGQSQRAYYDFKTLAPPAGREEKMVAWVRVFRS